MNLANTAPSPAPWVGFAPDGMFGLSAASGDVSLQLSFDWTAPAPWMPEARDSSRHGAELAALLVILQAEPSVLPVYARQAAPVVAEIGSPPWPLADSAVPPPAGVDGAVLGAPVLSAMEFLAMEPVIPASAWLLL